ncbi:MAG: PQQ-like beta-propeller repeat protein, partial [Vicinamibacterales bacterium]|nr:PQQ-like beta-propeller repeat protein [Vicinamibacterales bacterium]
MRRLLGAVCALTVAAGGSLLADNWPHWRGPSHNGVSSETSLPVSWSARCLDAPEPQATAAPAGPRIVRASLTVSRDQRQRRRGGRRRGGGSVAVPTHPPNCDEFATENIAWRLPLPAYSGSTPIIWGDLVFLNVATETASGSLELWAVDRRTQAVAWKALIADGNNMQRKQNMSSPSPVTDGEHVWVMTGVGALKAFDFDGNEIWSRNISDDYYPFGLNWGYASSPLLQGDALYVQVLHGMRTDDPSYLVKVDKMTGETLWYIERPTTARRESPDSYTTPVWLEYGGKTELVITGGDAVTGHDPDTGEELWRANVLNPENNGAYRIVASATIMGDLIVAPSRVRPMVAIRPGGSGDIGDSHIAWEFDRGPDVPTPVSDGEYVYVVTDRGVVYCLRLETGEIVYGPERLPSGTYSSSPILADGKIYVSTEEEGLWTVYRSGPDFEILSSNSF